MVMCNGFYFDELPLPTEAALCKQNNYNNKKLPFCCETSGKIKAALLREVQYRFIVNKMAAQIMLLKDACIINSGCVIMSALYVTEDRKSVV